MQQHVVSGVQTALQRHRGGISLMSKDPRLVEFHNDFPRMLDDSRLHITIERVLVQEQCCETSGANSYRSGHISFQREIMNMLYTEYAVFIQGGAQLFPHPFCKV